MTDEEKKRAMLALRVEAAQLLRKAYDHAVKELGHVEGKRVFMQLRDQIESGAFAGEPMTIGEPS